MNSAQLANYVAETMQVGSKSFAAASRLFDPSTRRSVLMLYAWCRHCDDVIDDQQLGFNRTDMTAASAPESRLELLIEQTRRVFAGETLAEPPFAALAYVVEHHQLDPRFAYDHLAGFAMDVRQTEYHSSADTLRYCYHVAGVVGLMMAQIMGVKDKHALDRACDLGIAFQLTNIARDIIDDAKIGRRYLPEQWLNEQGLSADNYAEAASRPALSRVAARLIEEAESYYQSAQAGLAALPWRSALAVATAKRVYQRIGFKVKSKGSGAWQQRIATSRAEKGLLMVVAVGDVLLSRIKPAAARSARLWQRP